MDLPARLRPRTDSASGSAAGLPDIRPSGYGSALASARKIRRRDLALVEQYLAQIRLLASAQARSAGDRGRLPFRR
jgi:hypothetical protein